MDNWRFLLYWRRSQGVVCMGEQLKSDSLPLPLSLSSRVVIELPAGVRPTGGEGGVIFTTIRLCIHGGGHPVAITTRPVQSFRCDIFTNPTLHHFFCLLSTPPEIDVLRASSCREKKNGWGGWSHFAPGACLLATGLPGN